MAYCENSSTKECYLTPAKMWESQAIKASQKVTALQKEITNLLDVIEYLKADDKNWRYKYAHAARNQPLYCTIVGMSL